MWKIYTSVSRPYHVVSSTHVSPAAFEVKETINGKLTSVYSGEALFLIVFSLEEYDVNLEVKYEGDRFTIWGFVEEVDTLPATYSKGKKKGNK